MLEDIFFFETFANTVITAIVLLVFHTLVKIFFDDTRLIRYAVFNSENHSFYIARPNFKTVNGLFFLITLQPKLIFFRDFSILSKFLRWIDLDRKFFV